MSKVFNMPLDNIPDNANSQNFPKWDSLNHINLMLALEQELNISFSDSELVTLNSLTLICEAIENKK
mgnify:CR=1 FL=1